MFLLNTIIHPKFNVSPRINNKEGKRVSNGIYSMFDTLSSLLFILGIIHLLHFSWVGWGLILHGLILSHEATSIIIFRTLHKF